MPDTTLDFGITLSNNPLKKASIGLEYDESTLEPLKEQQLWRKVILQAALDAALAPITPKARREKTKAIMWFSMQDKDFMAVCEMADVNPLSTIIGAKKHIKESAVIHRRKSHMKRLRSKHVDKLATLVISEKRKA